jgi:hypothetical protein
MNKKSIPKEFTENLELLPNDYVPKAFSEDLAELYGYEANGFSDWTISEVIELYRKTIEESREKSRKKVEP